MQRDIKTLQNTQFDLIVIGGGIFAACAAWDASLRGLSVALIEKYDFCSGTSANSFKFIHGGIRYLQHADITRLKSSCRERSAMLRVAPHLVQPMPVLIPTYGYGKSGKVFLGVGMLLYDLLTLGRNRKIRDPKRHINWTRFFSRQEVLNEYPDLDQNGLTGGAMFSDAQIYNPTRLVLSFIKSAVSKGANVANYIEARTLLLDGNTVIGVEALDMLTNKKLTLKGRAVLNAAGPWSDIFLQENFPEKKPLKNIYSRDACFVIKRRFDSNIAVALQARTKDPDALLSRPARHLFLVPWRDYTLVGVWHRVWEKHPEQVTVDQQEIREFIDEINWACPELNLNTNDVLMWNAGMVPFGDNQEGAKDLSYGKRSLFVDHKISDNLDKFVTLVGIRYTTARGDSAKAVDLICSKLGYSISRTATAYTAVAGGDIADFDQLVEQNYQQQKFNLSKKCIRALTHNYGTDTSIILKLLEEDNSLSTQFEGSQVIKAEIKHAVQAEMAFTLADVVFRRTDLATAGNPGLDVLRECANYMASLLNWGEEEIQQQLRTVLKRFPDWTT